MSFFATFVDSLVKSAAKAATDQFFGGKKSPRHQAPGQTQQPDFLSDFLSASSEPSAFDLSAETVDQKAANSVHNAVLQNFIVDDKQEPYEIGGEITEPLLLKLSAGEEIEPTDFLRFNK